MYIVILLFVPFRAEYSITVVCMCELFGFLLGSFFFLLYKVSDHHQLSKYTYAVYLQENHNMQMMSVIIRAQYSDGSVKRFGISSILSFLLFEIGGGGGPQKKTKKKLAPLMDLSVCVVYLAILFFFYLLSIFPWTNWRAHYRTVFARSSLAASGSFNIFLPFTVWASGDVDARRGAPNSWQTLPSYKNEMAL